MTVEGGCTSAYWALAVSSPIGMGRDQQGSCRHTAWMKMLKASPGGHTAWNVTQDAKSPPLLRPTSRCSTNARAPRGQAVPPGKPLLTKVATPNQGPPCAQYLRYRAQAGAQAHVCILAQACLPPCYPTTLGSFPLLSSVGRTILCHRSRAHTNSLRSYQGVLL